MRKSLLLLLVAGPLLLSCDKNKNADGSESLPNQQKLIHSALRDTVLMNTSTDVFKIASIPDTISVKMTNLTGDTLTTGLHYDIQRFENNKWIKFLPDQSFQDIGIALLPSASEHFTVRTTKEQAVYKSGTYRIVKYYLKQDFQKSREQFFVYAEFRIE